jgi:hypothetical protein
MIQAKHTAGQLAEEAVGLFLEALRRRGHDIEDYNAEDDETGAQWLTPVPAYDIQQATLEAADEVRQGVDAERGQS